MKQLAATTLLALALGIIASPASAQNQLPTQRFADLDMVEREVAAFMGVPAGDAGRAFSRIDRRMRLAACPRELQLEWYGARRDAVLVRCPVQGSWKIYVHTLGGAQAGQVAGKSARPAEPLVRRGDEVTVTIAGAGFSVSRSGEALEHGAAGEWIRIRVAKGSELRAQVLRSGAVALKLR